MAEATSAALGVTEIVFAPAAPDIVDETVTIADVADRAARVDPW